MVFKNNYERIKMNKQEIRKLIMSIINNRLWVRQDQAEKITNEIIDTFQLTLKQKPFPKCMVAEDGLLVCFDSADDYLGAGRVIAKGNQDEFDIGHYNTCWVMDNFKDCEIEIKVIT